MKWNSLMLSLILAGGAAMAHPPAGIAQSARENSEAKKLFTEGNELYLEGNFPEAEKKFREALTKYPRADQSDRTAYYVIVTLEKLRRFQDARTEIQNFHKNYPASRWREDVDQKSLVLGGLGASNGGFFELAPWTRSEEKMKLEQSMAADRGSTGLGPNPSREATLLQQQIRRNAEVGIAAARERLKADPSDPSVLANLGTIYLSKSPQALPFLLALSASEAASPNARKLGFFWAYRYNPDKEQVARVLMDMLAKKENDLVSETLFRMTIEEHRAVLQKIIESSHPDKLNMIEKIYNGGSITLRSDLIQLVSKLTDPRAWAFIADAAQNDKDLVVRQTATEVLARRNAAEAGNAVRPRVVTPRGAGNPVIPFPPPPAPK